MSLGSRIYGARKAKKLTQEQLAELLDVSTEAVSKWEQDRYLPGPDRIARMDEILGLSLYEEDGTMRNMRLFDEEHMSAFLKGKLNAGSFPEASRALAFAKEKHAGTWRAPKAAKIPYISHPLTMACHAFAMGLEDDVLLAAVFLHDVSEDCSVKPEDLPVCPEAQKIVALVTKPKEAYDEADYYRQIAECPKACMVKCLDRCHNLSSMPLGFTDAKIASYVRETETFYPELLRVLKNCPEYNNASFLLTYQMKALLAMARRIGGFSR